MDTLARVRIGEPSSSWVTLSPSGSVRRYLLRYHPVALSDGRDALLVEAMAEPEADAWMALASDQRLTVALYALSGELLSGNPRFTELYEHNPSLARLSGLLSSEPRGTALADALTREPELRGRGPLETARGERRFAGRRGSPLGGRAAAGAGLLFDQTERRVAEAEEARGALLEPLWTRSSSSMSRGGSWSSTQRPRSSSATAASRCWASGCPGSSSRTPTARPMSRA